MNDVHDKQDDPQEGEREEGATSAGGGRPMIKSLRTALGLAESAAVAELRQAFEKALEDALTPDEREDMMKKRDEMEKDREDMHYAEQITGALGVKTLADALPLVTKLRADVELSEKRTGELAELSIKVKTLSEAVETLKPKAELAERLEAESKKAQKDLFFAEQVRQGKLAPKDRPFWEDMFALDEKKVREHFGERKANSEVKLTERGLGTEGSTASDPRERLAELAEARMKEKGIAFTDALAQIKAENRELVEEIAGMVGPNGLRR